MTNTKSLIDIDGFVARQEAAREVISTLVREETRYKGVVSEYVRACGYTHNLSNVHHSEQIEYITLRSSTMDTPAHFEVCLNNGVFYDDPIVYLKVYPGDLLKSPEERAAMKAVHNAARKELIARRDAAVDQKEFEEYLRLKAKYEATP